MRALHQLVPTFEPGAVGGHILELQRLATEELGLRSDIYAEHLRWPGLEDRATSFTDYARRGRAQPGDVLLYHMAIGSVVADFARDRPEPLVVDHHNITPVRFLATWEPGAAHGCSWGRAQLAELHDRTALGVGDSPFNEAELADAGYRRTATAPILLDLDRLTSAVDDAELERLQEVRSGGGADWLFVGRISPNKCQHDLVTALAVHRRLYDPKARLHLVGGSSSSAYSQAITDYADALGLAGAVHMTGPVSAGVLEAHYRSADVFICVSEHEGFCIPLLEAMAHRVPIVAYASTAIPGTLGAAGILLADKSSALVAAAAARVVADPSVAGALVAAGTRRLAEFSLDVTKQRWTEILSGLDA